MSNVNLDKTPVAVVQMPVVQLYGCQKNGEGVCLSQSIKTKGTHSAVETTEE